MKKIHVTTIALVIGAALGFSVNTFLPHTEMATHPAQIQQAKVSDEPLYWVAPMDPNYQRDKPGKSPMGMDLIPVFAEDGAKETKPGTVTIDPAVENNLGVKVIKAQLAPLAPNIETVGYIAFDESQLWQTNVRVAGWVEKLNVNAVGDKVSKGDVLFTLYSPELVKAQEELLNAYRTGRNGLVKGATERLITLGVDRQQIQAIIKRGTATQTIDIKAKSDGIIASLNVREGGYLSPAQAVISAGPIDNVWVDAEVFERQSHWVKAGSKAQMTLDAIPGKEWQGEIDYVYPILDPQTRTLRLRLKFPNPQGELKPNMFANISLQPVTEESVLTIPKSAVIRTGGMTRVVLAEGNGKYRSARIQVGREAGDQIEVLQGLTEQSKVASSAHFLLDSESSQTADLARINGVRVNTDDSIFASEVWVEGDITMLMEDFGMITLKHLPVSEWNWEAGEMNFTLGPDVTLSGLKEGNRVRFLVQKHNDDFSLKSIERIGGKQ